MARYTLSKQERLSSLKDIDALFESGLSFSKYPLRLVWRTPIEDPVSPVRVMFSVPKKKFSNAVDRNRVKRVLRENYRLLKPDFYEKLPKNMPLHLGIMYTGKELPEHGIIQKSLSLALDRLITQIRKD
ncbi:MAG: ribonuclease P protein component [Bacteroidota bacterium]|nr:ribonuclease P protein component [Bacteroidota bacterium]